MKLSNKNSILSCRMHESVREAMEEAAKRTGQSLSSFMEMAAVQALPGDLRMKVEQVLPRKEKRSKASIKSA